MRLPQRLQLIKWIVLIGLLVSVLLSYNLWAGQRWFPKAPLFWEYDVIKSPYDYIQLLVLLTLIVINIMSRNKYYLFLLVLFSVYLCLDDQNRLQPWFFNYVLILLVLLFYRQRVDAPNNYTSIFISLQLLVALIYIYSGLQKINSHFINDTYSWMIEPLNSIFSNRQMTLLLRLGHSVPVIEILLGLGLLIKPTRYITLPLIIMMHIIILILLGPMGKSYNSVIWPWNLTMIALNIVLYGNVERERFFDVAILFRGVSFYIVITFMLIFPFFSFQNKYDSYLSSSLYSGNTHNCKIILSDKAYQALPYYIQNFVTTNANYNMLNLKRWCIAELNVPCIPERRQFENVRQYLLSITKCGTQDVQLEFLEREKLFSF